nr:MAG TPA: hypothetical protein [Caudoviricetes sp.]
MTTAEAAERWGISEIPVKQACSGHVSKKVRSSASPG